MSTLTVGTTDSKYTDSIRKVYNVCEQDELPTGLSMVKEWTYSRGNVYEQPDK